MVEETEPPPVEETVSLTQRQYDAIMQRITELEAKELQRPSKTVKLPTGKPEKFNGERDDQKARLWLSEVDTQIRMQMRMDPDMEEEDKLMIAESFLGEVAREQYNSKVSIDGPFLEYTAFRDWMLEAYAPSDLIAKYRTSYRSCRQKTENPSRIIIYVSPLSSVSWIKSPKSHGKSQTLFWDCTVIMLRS